jgi:hypothetical protein
MSVAIAVNPVAIRAVEVSRAGEVRAAACVRREPLAAQDGRPTRARVSAEEGALLVRAMERAGFGGCSTGGMLAGLVFSADAADVVVDTPPLTGVYEVPPRGSGAPTERLARSEVARAHRVEPSAIEVAVLDAPRPSGARGRESDHVLAVGLLTEDVTPVVCDLDAAGIETRRVATAHVALLEAAMRLGGVSEAVAVLDLQWHGAHCGVAVRAEGNEGAWAGGTGQGWGRAAPCFVRHINEAALWRVAQACAQRTGLSASRALEVACVGGSWADGADARAVDAARRVATAVRPVVTQYLDALATEASRSLAYIGHRHPSAPVTRVFVCGEGSALPGVVDRLGAELGVDVAVLTPGALAGVGAWPRDVARGGAWAPVVSVAVSALGVGAERAMDASRGGER